jgi:ubiquinone/menaquinone biosynthesis C-methylase UbiE
MGAVQSAKSPSLIRRLHVTVTTGVSFAVAFALSYDSRFSELIRRPFWKIVYNAVANDFLPAGVMKFVNLGYLGDASELDGENSSDIANRVSERLYDRVVGDTDLAGRKVVEVGCGGGAGTAHVARAYHPASVVGVDLNKDLIAWCRDQNDASNLTFLQGDAQDLPIESNSVDVVINIESSHCYPSRLSFFEEVARVLRPGGTFLFADIMHANGRKEADIADAQLGEVGLVIEDRVDITPNVLIARDVVSRSTFSSEIRDAMSSLVVPLVEESLCLAGTKNYKRLASGWVLYLHWIARKPTEDSIALSVPGAIGVTHS